MTDLATEIERLEELRARGVLTEEEFARAKREVLRESTPPPLPEPSAKQGSVSDSESLERAAKDWGLFIHLSVFACWIVPLGGIVLPVVLWQVKKDHLPGVDTHGRIVVNWVLSSLIYFALSVILALMVVGIPLLIALFVLNIVFPIRGAIKASNGEAWEYPLSIRFFNW